MASTEIATTIINLKSLFVDILSSPEIIHTSKLLKSLIQLLDTLLTDPSSSLLSFSDPFSSPLYSQTTQLRTEFYTLEHAHSQFESRLKAKDYVLSNAASEVAFLRSELSHIADRTAALPAAVNALSPAAASERLLDLTRSADRVTAQCIHAEMEASARRQALRSRLCEMDLLAARVGKLPQLKEPSFSQCTASQPPSPLFTATTPTAECQYPKSESVAACTSPSAISPSLSMLVPASRKNVQIPPLVMVAEDRSRTGSSSSSSNDPPLTPASACGGAAVDVAGRNTSFGGNLPKSARSASSSSSSSSMLATVPSSNGSGGAKIVKPLQPIKLRDGGVVEEVQGRKGKGQGINSARSVSAMGMSKRQRLLREHWTGVAVGEYARVPPEDISALMDACGYAVTKQMAKYILNQMGPKNENMVTWDAFYRVMTDQMSKLRPTK